MLDLFPGQEIDLECHCFSVERTGSKVCFFVSRMILECWESSQETVKDVDCTMSSFLIPIIQ